MRALLVHNPSAGSGRPTAEELLALLDEAGHSASYFSSKEDLYKEALARGNADIVIVAGGDGTVGTVARNVPDRKILFGILPLGTANNVSRCLDIKGEIETLVRKLRGAQIKRLDVGCAVGPWGQWNFLESVGWGALAKVVDTGVPSGSRESEIASGRELFAETLEQATPCRVCFEADGQRIERDMIFIEILNLGMTGPRVLISPSAKPGDQLLDIVYLTAERKQEMIDWLRATPDDTPIPLEEIKARKAVLVWTEGPLRVDDEVFDAPEMPSHVHVTIEPDGLRVCVPGPAD
jgi:diacylglycerol kinase (ATP)